MKITTYKPMVETLTRTRKGVTKEQLRRIENLRLELQMSYGDLTKLAGQGSNLKELSVIEAKNLIAELKKRLNY